MKSLITAETRSTTKTDRNPTPEEVIRVIWYAALRPEAARAGSLPALAVEHGLDRGYYYSVITPSGTMSDQVYNRVIGRFPSLTPMCYALDTIKRGGYHPMAPTEAGLAEFDRLVDAGEARLFNGRKGDTLFTKRMGEPTPAVSKRKLTNVKKKKEKRPTVPVKLESTSSTTKRVNGTRPIHKPVFPKQKTVVQNMPLDVMVFYAKLSADPKRAREFIRADRAFAEHGTSFSDALEAALEG